MFSEDIWDLREGGVKCDNKGNSFVGGNITSLVSKKVTSVELSGFVNKFIGCASVVASICQMFGQVFRCTVIGRVGGADTSIT